MTPNRQRALVFALITVGVLTVGLFGLRTLHAYREFRGHRLPPDFSAESQQVETDVELIRDWMTIPFIAKMYQVPPPVLYKALDLSPKGNQDKSLKQLNEEYYPDVQGFVETTVKAVVLENLKPPKPAAPSVPTP